MSCISCQLRLHDNHVQRPADFHRQTEERLVIFISPVLVTNGGAARASFRGKIS